MQQRLAGAARWYLVCVLAFSGGAKLFWPGDVETALREMAMLPQHIVRPVAWTLPAAELILAALLSVGRARLLTLPAVFFLSVVFTGVHLYLYLNGIILPCACLGASYISQASCGTSLFIAALSGSMLACSTFLVFRRPTRPKSNGRHGASREEPAQSSVPA